MTEMELIDLLTKKIPRKKGDLILGVGDDCSIIRTGKKEILISCDSLVENIHFKKKWGPWKIWGHKAAASALSDIAAMGGKPRFAWINLAIPANRNSGDIRKFYSGMQKIFRRFKTVIAGGNITRSIRGFSATTTVWGEAKAGKTMLRENAKPGEKVFVSGTLGLAPFKPAPHIPLGEQLVKQGCRCCIDVSDGLLKDLDQIAQASKVKIVLYAEKIPHRGNLKKAVTRGEDYVLAFTMKHPGPRTMSHKKITEIGVVKRGKPGVQILDKKGSPLSFSKLGFQHKMA